MNSQKSQSDRSIFWYKAVPWVLALFILLVSIWTWQLDTVGWSGDADATEQTENSN